MKEVNAEVTIYFKDSPKFVTFCSEQDIESLLTNTVKHNKWSMFKDENGKLLTAFNTTQVTRIVVSRGDKNDDSVQ